jgi:DNA transposition AAA+ family ATPase
MKTNTNREPATDTPSEDANSPRNHVDLRVIRPTAGYKADVSLPVLVQRAMDEEGLTQKLAAAKIDIGVSVFNQWRQGKYRGDIAAVDTKVRVWLQSRGDRVALRHMQQPAPEFFLSDTADQVRTRLNYAQSLRDIATVVGASGAGKTSTVRQYARDNSNVWIATMTPAMGMADRILPALHVIASEVGAVTSNRAQKLLQSICDRVRHTDGLIVIDEAHHLNISALDAIRSIHDDTDVGLALVGGIELAAKIQKMPQLHSRVGLRLHVTKVTRRDVDAQLDAWKITNADSRKLLHLLATRAGGLRKITKTLKLASIIAANENTKLDHDHVKSAAHTLSDHATGEE